MKQRVKKKRGEIFSPLDKLLGALYFGAFTYLLPFFNMSSPSFSASCTLPPPLPLLSVRTKPMGKEIHHFYYIYPVCDYGRQSRTVLYQAGTFIALCSAWDIQNRLPYRRLTRRFEIQNANSSVQCRDEWTIPSSPPPPFRNPISAQTVDPKPLYTSLPFMYLPFSFFIRVERRFMKSFRCGYDILELGDNFSTTFPVEAASPVSRSVFAFHLFHK